MDKSMDELFEDVRAHWDEASRHTAFLKLAQIRGELARAAALYRDEKAARPERGDEADKRLAAVMVLATESLQLTRTPPPEVKKSTWIVIGGVFVGLALYAVKRAFFG
jgi:hypothetical protein